MSEERFKHKLVAVLNKSIEPGKIMNALAHMCIGLGSAIAKPDLRLSDYRDADGGAWVMHCLISRYLHLMCLSLILIKI